MSLFHEQVRQWAPDIQLEAIENLKINKNKPGGTMQKSEVNKQTFRSWIGCRIGCRIGCLGNIIFDILEPTAV